MKVKVRVLQPHIDLAEQSATGKDPIALALRTSFAQRRRKSQIEILSDTGSAQVEYKNGRTVFYDFNLPKEAQTFLWRFDNGLTAIPMSFTLDLQVDRSME